jgi:MFS family permease
MSRDAETATAWVSASPRDWRGDRRVMLAALFAVGLVNYLDRTALSVLQVPIKAELGLSDAQLGALTGLCFVIPYTLLSLPLGRLADRSNRTRLMAFAILVWSGLTSLSGLAWSFWSLAGLRMGVAVGESACLPTSYSLLADAYPAQSRGRATAVFGLAYPIGTMLGLAGVAALAEAVGWRTTFVAVGAAGLTLVPLLLLLVREPARGATDLAPAAPDVPPLREAVALLWASRPFRYITCAASAQAVTVYAMVSWGVPFYVRTYGMSVGDAGLAFGLLLGCGGGAGILIGGMIADRLGRRGRHWYLLVPAIACAMVFVAGLGQFLAPQLAWALAAGAVAASFLNVFLAPTYAVTQSLVAPGLRGFATAAIVTASGVLGGGVGPLLTGWISDALHADLGAASLRYAAAAPLAFSLLAAVLYARAATLLRASDPGCAND